METLNLILTKNYGLFAGLMKETGIFCESSAILRFITIYPIFRNSSNNDMVSLALSPVK